VAAYEEIDLEHPELPAVNLGSRQNPSWFAPEKLIVMPYQIYSRAVPSTLMSDMHKVACNSPEDNRGLIEGEGMSKLRINADPIPPHVGLCLIYRLLLLIL
jgi:eukaryotic translation initiation factor 2C